MQFQNNHLLGQHKGSYSDMCGWEYAKNYIYAAWLLKIIGGALVFEVVFAVLCCACIML